MVQKKVRRKGRKSLKIRKRPLHFVSHQQEQMYRKSDLNLVNEVNEKMVKNFREKEEEESEKKTNQVKEKK